MFKTIIQGIKIAGRAKAALEAIDDDVDLDGQREIDQLKDDWDSIVDLAEHLFATVKVAAKRAGRLIEHVAKAAKEA